MILTKKSQKIKKCKKNRIKLTKKKIPIKNKSINLYYLTLFNINKKISTWKVLRKKQRKFIQINRSGLIKIFSKIQKIKDQKR